jgi:hypothetical protein
MGPETPAGKWVVKAMGLTPRVHQVLLEIVNGWEIRVNPLVEIFIELYAGVSLGLHVK